MSVLLPLNRELDHPRQLVLPTGYPTYSVEAKYPSMGRLTTGTGLSSTPRAGLEARTRQQVAHARQHKDLIARASGSLLGSSVKLPPIPNE